jgi:HK97 gp10 family phage protein
MKMEMQLQGVDDVLKMLRSLPPEVVSKRGGPVRFALRKGALVIRDEARRRVPVDTGELRDALQVVRGKYAGNGEKAIVRVGDKFYRSYVKNRRNIQMGRATQVSAKQYELEEMPAIYGRFLEYGTSKMSPKPWLRPAFAAKASEAIRTVETELVRGIDRVLRKIAKGGLS